MKKKILFSSLSITASLTPVILSTVSCGNKSNNTISQQNNTKETKLIELVNEYKNEFNLLVEKYIPQYSINKNLFINSDGSENNLYNSVLVNRFISLFYSLFGKPTLFNNAMQLNEYIKDNTSLNDINQIWNLNNKYIWNKFLIGANYVASDLHQQLIENSNYIHNNFLNGRSLFRSKLLFDVPNDLLNNIKIKNSSWQTYLKSDFEKISKTIYNFNFKRLSDEDFIESLNHNHSHASFNLIDSLAQFMTYLKNNSSFFNNNSIEPDEFGRLANNENAQRLYVAIYNQIIFLNENITNPNGSYTILEEEFKNLVAQVNKIINIMKQICAELGLTTGEIANIFS
ncbi:MAG5150 family histidine triad lipoprotein [Mycoplasmopsis felifaucium]|uniref:Lipoprotein n=1 Tax=Mycoplasmopsis felifaucium TaxID=35768 RepID=A0ABZ2RQH1_9BACT